MGTDFVTWPLRSKLFITLGGGAAALALMMSLLVNHTVVDEVRRLEDRSLVQTQAAIDGFLAHRRSQLLERCRLVPGNHDTPALLREVFSGCYGAAPAGSACFAERLGDWTILALDSHFPGEIGGKVGGAQLAWLRKRLAEAADAPTLLFLHHPPGPIGTPWLDGMALLEPAPLVEILASASQLRAILCGHVHQDTTASVSRVPLITTPSTCFQFRPGSVKPAFDDAAPAFRVIELEGDAFTTRVVRVGEPASPVAPP